MVELLPEQLVFLGECAHCPLAVSQFQFGLIVLFVVGAVLVDQCVQPLQFVVLPLQGQLHAVHQIPLQLDLRQLQLLLLQLLHRLSLAHPLHPLHALVPPARLPPQ